jgi:PEP-CTERM motif
MPSGIRLAFANLLFCGLALATSAPASAGLINPTSTVNINFDYENPTALVGDSGTFDTDAPGPFSLAAPIYPPNPAIHTTEPFNIAADTGFWFTNTAVTIYNNADPAVPFCFSSSHSGSACTDAYDTFDFVFANEDITKVSVDPSSSSDFLPATFGSHVGLTLVSPTEFTVDVTGDDPAYLDTLVIDVTTKSSAPATPEPATWALMLLGFAGLGYVGYRRMGGQRRTALA